MRTLCGTILAAVAATTCVCGADAGVERANIANFATAEESPLVLFTAMTGKPGEKEAEEYFGAAQKAGFGQVMIYPRSGLEWEYMGEEWLDFVGACLKEAKSRGMKAWLYDEYKWPSGSCRGRVTKENPEWTYTEYAVRKLPDGSFSWEIKRNDQLSMNNNGYFDVNAYSADAIRRFIELTHKKYEQRFSAYMKDGTIPGIFTDEPAHPSPMKWAAPRPVVTFRWWKELEDQYRQRTGRDFRADIEESLRDPSKTAVWEVYTELKGEQFRSAYFDQIRAWAKGAGIETCGHMINEHSPWGACNCNGLPLNTLRGLSIPGMDKIYSRLDKDDEWITYATAQYAIERNSSPGRDTLDAHGGIELFALGPCDMTIEQMAQRIWTAALYGMDTYFVSLYHTTAKGFLDKGGYAMFTSPTQPWFYSCGELHDAARKAATWSRKRFLRDVAVRYPQRLFGRISHYRAMPGEKPPPLCELVNKLAWNQVSFELLQDDEKSDLPFVFAFRGTEIVEERTGKSFRSASAVLDWLRAARGDAWRVVDANGSVVPGLLVRRYADGTATVLNMTEQTFAGLLLVKGESGGIERFSLPACGVRLFADGEMAWTPGRVLGDVAAPDGWTVSFDRPSLRRIWFSTNGVSVLKVSSALSGVRFAVCNYPEGIVKVSLDGKMLAADRPCKSAPYGYAQIYRETEPMDIEAGTHELKLEGRADNSVFLPVLWLAGEFATAERGSLHPAASSIPRLTPLAAIGHGDFAGVATYRTTVNVPDESGIALALDTGGLPARVRLGGVDLGERSLPPWEWNVPDCMAGKAAQLEVDVTTSIRPVFGPESAPGVRLREKLWCKTELNASRSGLCSAQWLKGRREGRTLVIRSM